MRVRVVIAALALGWAAGTGCQRPDSTAAPASVRNEPPMRAQPKLATVKLWLGGEEMIAEVARTAGQIRTGMMFRAEMAENEGMIFVFPQPHQASFYMRNTILPLSCAYIDSQGAILEIHDMKPRDETPIPAATDRVRYVLETRQGWFERHGIGVGTVLRTEQGTLEETFFSRR
jgi:hypothetical protein